MGQRHTVAIRTDDWYASRIVPILGRAGTIVPELREFLQDLRESYLPHIDEPASYGQNGMEYDVRRMVSVLDAALEECGMPRRGKHKSKKSRAASRS